MTSSLDVKTDALGDLLADQLALCSELETALRQKQDCLVQLDLEHLQQRADCEQSLSLQLSKLELLRQAAARELTQDLGLPDDAGVSRIVSALPDGAARDGLNVLGQALSAKLKVLSQLNDDNRMLASGMLEYTGMVLRLISRGPGGTSYGASGRLSDGQARAILDDRI
jgi:flagellar biosynthesis/type III secretory pathway chaperone